MPNYIKAIFVFAERHAANLERQFPTLTKIGYGAGGGVLATGTTGAVKWAFTHPQNHQGTLAAAKQHLEDNGHDHTAV